MEIREKKLGLRWVLFKAIEQENHRGRGDAVTKVRGDGEEVSTSI